MGLMQACRPLPKPSVCASSRVYGCDARTEKASALVWMKLDGTDPFSAPDSSSVTDCGTTSYLHGPGGIGTRPGLAQEGVTVG